MGGRKERKGTMRSKEIKSERNNKRTKRNERNNEGMKRNK
jgi:hypothetical protein